MAERSFSGIQTIIKDVTADEKGIYRGSFTINIPEYHIQCELKFCLELKDEGDPSLELTSKGVILLKGQASQDDPEEKLMLGYLFWASFKRMIKKITTPGATMTPEIDEQSFMKLALLLKNQTNAQ